MKIKAIGSEGFVNYCYSDNIEITILERGAGKIYYLEQQLMIVRKALELCTDDIAKINKNVYIDYYRIYIDRAKQILAEKVKNDK